jgi:hypothetical protein
VLWLLKSKVKKANKLELNWNDLFSKQADLVNAKTTQLSEFPIDMSTLKISYKNNSKHYKITKLTDKSFVGAVKAQVKTNQRTGQSRKRLLKAQKSWFLERPARTRKGAGTSS